MLDGLRPDTCVLVADKIRMDQYGERANAYDLIEYGCDGENRVELRRRRMESHSSDPYAMAMAVLDRIIEDVNRELRHRGGCTCR